jgi:L-lysine 2,3-aminomutase
MNQQEIAEYIDWLENTLIRDLIVSGYDATADDFRKCVYIIRRLQQEIGALKGRK